jgi:N-acetylneuraminate synthase
MKTTIIGEIGINHNGSVKLAKQLIDLAKVARMDYVKFQKRTPEICVPDAQKNIIKSTPWGEMTYLDYKHKIEFWKNEYDEINDYCNFHNIKWTASVWDIPSCEFMRQYTDIIKIPSALITDIELLKCARKLYNILIISTGMSTEEEIEKAINIGNPDIIMHTNSSYPAKYENLNLEYITWLKDKYPNKTIGYSGHEYGLTTTFAAVALGATWIERHITLDRTMWGSDQIASVEKTGCIKLVDGIRSIEKSMKGYGNRIISEDEYIKRKSLRGN